MKIKEYRGIIIIAVVVLGVAFYWSEVRPVMVRRGCSLVEVTISANPGTTKEQASENERNYRRCRVESGLVSAECYLLGQNSKEKGPESEKKVVRSATESEYDKCLRQKGLE